MSVPQVLHIIDGDFMKGKHIQLKAIEIALLFGLAASLIWGIWSLKGQTDLRERVIRLHVVANSDGAEDQALKLKVRDRVLQQVEALLEDSSDREAALALLAGSLEPIAEEAEEEIREQGYDYSVTAELEDLYFPTKEYDGFALPAGEYKALRIQIGSGGGKNWWCVVFPPLCLAAAEENLDETALASGLTEEDVSLITEEDTKYVFKFKSIEIWDEIRNYFS